MFETWLDRPVTHRDVVVLIGTMLVCYFIVEILYNVRWVEGYNVGWIEGYNSAQRSTIIHK